MRKTTSIAHHPTIGPFSQSAFFAIWIVAPLLWLSPFFGLAQPNKNTKEVIKHHQTTPQPMLNLYVGAFRPLVSHQGYKVGVEDPLLTITKEKHKRNGKEKIKVREFYTATSLIGYYHRRNHTGFILQQELGFRNKDHVGILKEFSFGLGVMRSFMTHTTYRVDENGQVKKIPLAGSFYGIPSFSFGLGKNLYDIYEKPISIHVKQTTWLLVPYNSFASINIALEAGISYTLIKNPLFRQKQ